MKNYVSPPALKSFNLIAILVCFALFSQAQQQSIRASVYFETNERLKFDAAELDNACKKLPDNSTATVIGYADYVGDDAYNQALSEDRARNVSEYLKKKCNGTIKITTVIGKGEQPQGKATDGDANARRVDVVFEFAAKAMPQTPKQQREVKTTEPLKESPSEEAFEIDTVVRENIVLKGLSFIGGRHFPTRESMPELYKLVETMKKYPTLKIEIQGHICCDYSQPDGMDNDTGEPFLSKNRAEFVYEFLKGSGISESRMTYIGLGSTQPKVFPERTEEDQQTNRRVEIKIVDL